MDGSVACSSAMM
jgi:hypothetical protein